jgi:hypothetical protein
MNEAIKDILDIIAIPLTTLVLGLVLPYRWQQRERDTKIKTELVAEIVDLFMTTAMTVYMYKTRCRNGSDTDTNQKSELEQVYRQWKVQSCVIGSKLHAYFPKSENRQKLIHKQWNHFADLVAEFYWHCWEIEGEIRIDELDKLANRKGIYKGRSVEKYKEALFSIKAEIIQKILASKITGFADRKPRPVLSVRRF